jgi:hypothetical protein
MPYGFLLFENPQNYPKNQILKIFNLLFLYVNIKTWTSSIRWSAWYASKYG